MLLSKSVPSSSRPVYWMSVTSLAVGGAPSPSFSTLKPRPEAVRWKTCAEVPAQATATPIATSKASASQSLTTEPLGSGRSGTAVTDMGHFPECAKGGEPYRRPARKQEGGERPPPPSEGYKLKPEPEFRSAGPGVSALRHRRARRACARA